MEPSEEPVTNTKPMRRRLKTTSHKELYDIVQLKQNQFAPKYLQHCKKFGIMYPAVNERERDHLCKCHNCQKTWPLYLFDQHYTMGKPIDEVTQAWQNLPERDREDMLPRLEKADRSWLKDMLKRRTPSSFQIFTRETIAADPKTFEGKGGSELSSHLSKIWREQSEETKYKYKQLALAEKVERANKISALPDFKKKQIALARAETKRVSRECHPSKPLHAYLMYQQDEWKREKRKPEPMPYAEFLKTIPEKWSKISEERRKAYDDRVAKNREIYFKTRNDISKNLKLAKQQKRTKKKKSDPVTPGGETDDDVSDFIE